MSALISKFAYGNGKVGRFTLRDGLLDGIDGTISRDGSRTTQRISIIHSNIDSLGEPYSLEARINLTLGAIDKALNSVSLDCRFGRTGSLFESVAPSDVLAISANGTHADEIRLTCIRVGSRLVAHFDADGKFISGDDHSEAGRKFTDISKLGLKPQKIDVTGTIGNLLSNVPTHVGILPLFEFI